MFIILFDFMMTNPNPDPDEFINSDPDYIRITALEETKAEYTVKL